MNEYTFSDMNLGLIETLILDISQKQVNEFISLSGDSSTIHVDDGYAKSRGYKRRLVHGILITSYISQLIGMQLPGKHGVLRTISCNYHRPCYVPNRLTIIGRVQNVRPSIRIVQIDIVVTDLSGDVLVTATAESVMKL